MSRHAARAASSVARWECESQRAPVRPSVRLFWRKLRTGKRLGLMVCNVCVGKAQMSLRARRCSNGIELDVIDAGGTKIVCAPLLALDQDRLPAAFGALL